MYLAQRYNTATRVRIEPPTSGSGDQSSTTRPPRLPGTTFGKFPVAEKISIWGMLLLAVGWVVEKRQ